VTSTSEEPGAARVVLDVRPLIAAGEEPFSRIMATVATLEGRALELHSPFEPVPLHHALGRRGMRHDSRRIDADHWVTVYRQEPAGEATAASEADPSPGSSAPTGPGGDLVLDVRGLEPPEPMVRTLAALESLPSGATLVQVNDRVPAFLLPELDQRGWRYRVTEGPDAVVTRIGPRELT